MKITKKSFQAFFTRASFAGLLLGGALAAQAQTSGTFNTQLTATTNYSTAPWFITSGSGTYPDGGGTATFNSTLNTVIGTVPGTNTLTVNVSPTLSSIVYNNPFSTTLAAGTGTSIIASTSGLTLNALLTAANTPTLFQITNTISSPISGGGLVGLTKIGAGTVTLSGNNTYTGGTHINGGLLVVSSSAAVGDAVFGAAGAGNGLSFNGGGLFVNVTSGLTSARDIFLDTNGGTIYTNTSAILNGVISGGGAFTVRGFATGQGVTLTNTNTYTGATITSGATVSLLTLSGNGSIAASSSYDLGGTLAINNSVTTGINRLSDTATITSRGVIINYTGGATASSETVGALNLTNGITTVTVTPGAGGSSFNAASFVRQNASLLSVRGTGLGGAPGANVATITSTTAPTLVGLGGGAAGSTNINIVPWAYGNLTANSALTTTANINASLVTYTAGSGFRPLATTEYATAFGVNVTDNVRVTGDLAVPAASTANAILFAPAAAATLSGGPINVTSGAFLYSPTVDITTLSTVSAPLNFGPAEGVIINTTALAISGAISGTGGLTMGSPNSTGGLALSGANTYTGTTNIVGGAVSYTGNVPNDGVTPGAFGLGTSALVLTPGQNSVFLLSSTAGAVFSRDLLVNGSGPALAYFGVTGDSLLTMNGNISLQHNLTLYGGTTAATALVVNGLVSGPALLTDAAGAYTVLNNNNTFTGGLNISTGLYAAGSNTAFGTGTIYFSSTGTVLNASTDPNVTRTLANNVFLSATGVFGGVAPLNFTGGVNLNGARTIAFSNTALTTFSGVVDTGSLTKNGLGALALNSPTGNAYTGGTVFLGTAANASVLYVNNTSGSATGTGTVSIAGAAAQYSTLAGNGTISGATSIGGRLSPGNGTGLLPTTAGTGSIGQINFGSSLALSSSTTSSLYLEAASASSFDKITVTGAFTLNGTVFFATTSGYTIQAGDTFTLATYGSLVAGGVYTFNTTGATLGAGVTLTTSVGANNLVITAVPEPGTWAAVVGGLGLLGGMQFARRRRNRGA